MSYALRAHLQVLLWKPADQQSPPAVSATLTDFGWKIENGIPAPVVGTGDPAPPELVDVIRCQWKVEGKKCSTASCSCHKEHITCTSYCNCCGEDGCHNPYTQKAATIQASDLELEAEEQELEDVAVAEEPAEESDEYDTDTEFLTD